MRKLFTGLLVLAVLAVVSPASAHLVTRPKDDSRAAIHASQIKNMKHARYVCVRGGRVHKRWACIAADWLEREARETRPILQDTGYLPPALAIKLGQQMAARVGIVGFEWSCLHDLWGRLESSWHVRADNPRSDAYGIPQALPGSKMGEGWQHSAYVQIKWGLGYVLGRYRSACNARSHRLIQGWY